MKQEVNEINTVLKEQNSCMDWDLKPRTAEHIFSIRQILEKKWEYNKDVCQLFIDFQKAYDSIKGESCTIS